MKTNTYLLAFILTIATIFPYQKLAAQPESAATLTVTLTPSNYNDFNVTCFGAQDGSITASVTGGSEDPSYTYEWSVDQNTQIVTGLAAGYYRLTVVDASTGAWGEAEITLVEPEEMRLDVNVPDYSNGKSVSCHFCLDGSVTLTPDLGVPPYTYYWSDGITIGSRTGMHAGDYGITVTDNNGCTLVQEIGLSAPERDDWTMTGNAGTDPATQYIGTSDNKHLVFKTNGIERMKITSSGLNIFNNVSRMDTLKITRIMAQDGDSLMRFGLGTISINQLANRIYANPINSVYGMGIGTLSSGFGLYSIGLGYGAIATGSKSIAIGTEIIASGQNSIVIGLGAAGGALNVLNNSINNSLMVGFNSNIPTLTVTGSAGNGTTGKVIIGSGININTSYQYGLYVGKGILAEKVKVAIATSADWSDRVFASDYMMMPLPELAFYIKRHKHLPNIPSASEVVTSGIDLGEMTAKLLEKIEELTLHVIQLEEEVNKLKMQQK